ncbi:coiled-coil-helix-coiled-coil-helix domain-containing protein 7 isoform X1 [Solenopsis invicta]|uniref:coiled-coil-helix-coiled-coil-helix domain-containing protein 7 isoform X1 n=1 Tax=Solenopsis invicta TaxID=13686 RepID=UPI0005959D0B|nr:coiled-coil-helix-coiled-coil-helix domain-containing protein 7 isoform X1 [Solenopsis invicta]
MDTRRDSSDIEERANVTSRRALRRNQETDNPCYKEHLQSLRCLESNQADRNACEPYFLNYKNCKNFWRDHFSLQASVQQDRKLKGIEPYLPPLEERVKIKADFLNSR